MAQRETVQRDPESLRGAGRSSRVQPTHFPSTFIQPHHQDREKERDKDISQHPTFTQPHIMRKTETHLIQQNPPASSRETETVSDREGAITARQRGGQQVQFGEENGGPACAVLYVRRDPWYVCMYMSV